MNVKTLLLVDGSSYLYRAFHALPDLRNKRGEPTAAIYGMLNMLRRLQKDTHAEYTACVFDAKGKTFRDDLYPQYKATRAPMPDDLGVQIEPLHEILTAMGWPLLAIEGVEADDVIATLACAARQEGIDVVIATGDKDLAQLVCPGIRIENANPRTGEREILDEAGVERKFGVKPERITDYLALIGDSVDNIPGVDKVGPKTAAKWLAQYGTLDEVLAHADEIGGVVGDNLRRVRDWLPRARELLTVKSDVPLPLEVKDLALRPRDVAKLAEMFDRFEFRAWRRELDEQGAQSVAPSAAPATDEPSVPEEAYAPRLAPRTPKNYEAVLTTAQLDAWIEKLDGADLTAIDTETTSLSPLQARLVGISFSIAPDEGAYIPVGHRYAGAPDQLALALVLEKLKPWLENRDRAKLGQCIKYDMHVFANHGIKLSGIAHDTLLQSYVLESHKPHDMDNLAERHLNMQTLSYDEVTGKGASRIAFEQVAIDRATEYAAEDADVTLQLHGCLYPQIERDDKLKRIYAEIEMPVTRVLQVMERNGVRLDTRLLGELSREFGAKIMALEAKAHEIAGQPFNLGSPRQIQDILFEKQQLPVRKKTPSGQPSTDEDVLAELAQDYPLPKIILEHRGLAKLKSTYTDKLAEMINAGTGRVHTNYAQAVAVTGRLASNDPNLQNIPIRTAEGRRIREAFIADECCHIVSADYSQIELRIMAHISQDANLLRAFAEGEDIHRATAAEIFGLQPDEVEAEQRRYAKVINFGLIYGMSAFGLSRQLGIERSAGQQYMERYFARYPGVAQYMQRTREAARAQGYVETVFGRRLWLPEIRSSNAARRGNAERAAINAPMQGTAADLIKLAMVAVQNWIEGETLRTRLIMQVHDELVLEVPDEELSRVRAELPRLMGSVAQLSVPLLVEVGIGLNWDEAH
jgi:DNA polymerase-1